MRLIELLDAAIIEADVLLSTFRQPPTMEIFHCMYFVGQSLE